MNKRNSEKICILVDSLSKGGAEKAAAELSNLLFTSGKEIVVISLKNDITYPYSGNLINLGTNESSFKLLKQLKKTFLLRKHLKQINPDFVIDFRMRSRQFMEFILHSFVFDNKKMIYVVQNYQIDWHLPKGKWFLKIYAKGKIVGVSKEIKKVLEVNYGFSNVYYIPNFVNPDKIRQMSKENVATSIKGKYIVCIGRLTNYTKQHDKLIAAYKQTNLAAIGVKLLILGDGPDRLKLKKLIAEQALQDTVKLLGYVKNPYPYLKDAMFKVLCSRVEGLPLSIIESLVLKTPVVSFDCKSGPSEMIVDGENGFLIENQNFDALKKAMELLVNNAELALKLKAGTNKYLNDYLPKNNLKLWNTLLAN